MKTNFKKLKYANLFAFTLAEAVLVMTILGIIATITVVNLKPAQYKEKALTIKAEKFIGELDTTLTQIKLLNSYKQNLFKAKNPSNESQYCLTICQSNATECLNCSKNLIGLYLKLSRTACNSTKCPCYSPGGTRLYALYLQNGSCINRGYGTNLKAFVPGDTSETTITRNMNYIFFDINGEEGPNIFGKDQFRVPLSSEGLWYGQEAISGKVTGKRCGANEECASTHCTISEGAFGVCQ